LISKALENAGEGLVLFRRIEASKEIASVLAPSKKRHLRAWQWLQHAAERAHPVAPAFQCKYGGFEALMSLLGQL